MTPETVHERFAQYLKDQDLDGLGSLFDEDAMFVRQRRHQGSAEALPRRARRL